MIIQIKEAKNQGKILSEAYFIKIKEIMKLKYYQYIQQHPEKYGVVDRDKFAAQADIYFEKQLETFLKNNKNN